MNLLTVVAPDCEKEKFKIYEFILLAHSALQWLIGESHDMLQFTIARFPDQHMLSLVEFRTLSRFACTHTDHDFWVKNQKFFADVPMALWENRIRRVLNHEHLHDKVSVAQFISEFNLQYKKQVPSKDQRSTNAALAVLESLSVNNMQMAVAQIAYYLSSQHPKAAYIVPGGFGKSRIVCVTALLALFSKSFSKVHIVYPNVLLQRRDQAAFSQVFRVAQLEAKVAFHTTIDFDAKKNELIILDEGDEWLLNEPEKCLKRLENQSLLLFTATISGGAKQDLEC